MNRYAKRSVIKDLINIENELKITQFYRFTQWCWGDWKFHCAMETDNQAKNGNSLFQKGIGRNCWTSLELCIKQGGSFLWQMPIWRRMNLTEKTNEELQHLADIYFPFQNQSEPKKNVCKILCMVKENYNIFEHYGVDLYLDTHIFVVNPKYRSIGIGGHLLKTNLLVCAEFGIKLSSILCTSNFSNRIADNVGYKIDKIFWYLVDSCIVSFICAVNCLIFF